MKLRTVAKLGVIVSVILFCVGVGWYSFLQVSVAREGKDLDLRSLVPADCVGLVDTDNFDYLLNELPQTAYADKLTGLFHEGLLSAVFNYLDNYSRVHGTHGLSNQTTGMMVSFHAPVSPANVVVYFRVNGSGKLLLDKLTTEAGNRYEMRKESYRGKDILVCPMRDGTFVSAYSGNGFLVISHQKRLIERVVDAQKDHTSMADHPLLEGMNHRAKMANYLSLNAHTSSLPLMGEGHSHNWCDFDVHLSSEVFYMSGAMHVPDTCVQRMRQRLEAIGPVSEDRLLMVAGEQRVDSCMTALAGDDKPHTLFDECVANLSHDASYIMVVDMEKVAETPRRFVPYLPAYLIDHIGRFRSFILSVQITKTRSGFSHIFVFTYKE